MNLQFKLPSWCNGKGSKVRGIDSLFACKATDCEIVHLNQNKFQECQNAH